MHVLLHRALRHHAAEAGRFYPSAARRNQRDRAKLLGAARDVSQSWLLDTHSAPMMSSTQDPRVYLLDRPHRPDALVVLEMAGACLTDVFKLLPTPYSTDLVEVIAHDRDHHRGRVPV